MLGIKRPDRHALPRFTSSKTFLRRRPLPPARAGSSPPTTGEPMGACSHGVRPRQRAGAAAWLCGLPGDKEPLLPTHPRLCEAAV